MPNDSDAYRVVVTPSTRTYYPGLHRFIFTVQYGNLVNGEFQPNGKPVMYQSETLPMI